MDVLGPLEEMCFDPENRLVGARNYLFWASGVRQLLKAHDVWDLVQRTSSSGSNSEGDNNATSHDPAKILQKKKDTFTFLLTFSVSRGVLPTVIRLSDDPAGLWECLRKQYENAATLRRFLLKRQLFSLRMTRGMWLEDFLAIIKDIVDQLVQVLEAVEDRTLICVVLWGLPPSWESFKGRFRPLMLIDENQDLSITFADFEDQLREYEYFLFAAKPRGGRRNNMYRQAYQY